jgi:methionine synthase II (cobalamin-independent)
VSRDGNDPADREAVTARDSAAGPQTLATGLGSLPGTEIAEAVNETFGELDFPYLPELPARGPGADLIGRSANFLVDLPVELYAGRWRVAARGGADLRRAKDLLDRDLDVLTERAEGYRGPLKVQSAGPWTLAAGIELALGGRILKDHGGVRDLSDSLAEGLAAHVAQVRRRVPGAQVILQIDEPSLPAVLTGRVPTDSGLHTYRSVDTSRARDTLRSIVDSAGVPVVVHCCAPDAPLNLFREAGAKGFAIDLSLVKDLDPIGESIEAGLTMYAGVAPTAGPNVPEAKVLADRVSKVWRDLGFPAEQLTQHVITPACGLAGATPAYARAVLEACREAARRLSGS